jgi:hypothetical protein
LNIGPGTYYLTLASYDSVGTDSHVSWFPAVGASIITDTGVNLIEPAVYTSTEDSYAPASAGFSQYFGYNMDFVVTGTGVPSTAPEPSEWTLLAIGIFALTPLAHKLRRRPK